MIDVEHISKSFGPTQAVKNVSFIVSKGEVVGFLGPNGAGKSTTMRILTCYLPADEGTARVAGFDIATHSLEVRKRIGYLPENNPLYMDMGVFQSLQFVAALREVPQASRRAKIKQVLEMCGLELLRAALGLSVDEHRDRVARLWSRFSEIAAKNPNAWIQRSYTPAELRDPTPDNRMVSFPYPKLMNSNNNVDQGAALILTSVETAQRLGIAREKWVFPWAGADAHDYYMVSERDNLHSSPGIRFAGRRALELAGVP